MYSRRSLDGYFYKSPGFYILYIPVCVPYMKIYSRATDAGFKLKEQLGPILESGKPFGSGWIGVEIEKPAKPAQMDEHVVHFTGDFETFEYKGPYKTLGKAYKTLKKERPNIKECYNLYLDDPEKVLPDNCRTVILFR
jgi:hypothetical protein